MTTEKAYTDAQLEAFRTQLQDEINARQRSLSLSEVAVNIERGYKFDTLWQTNGAKPAELYKVEHITGNIYGCRSWYQVNDRRWFGTVETISQYDWFGVPVAGKYIAQPKRDTDAYRRFIEFENERRTQRKKVGRKRKASKLSS